ncbi:MAG TPA: ParA family protein [Stellaceae bacterium]|jgi:chromosome partitioning protein
MTAVVGCVSQKGGVGKSSLARLLAREYAAAGRRVLLADLDTLQATSVEWGRRREEGGIAPAVPVRGFENVKKALKAASAGGVERLVLDSRGFADRQTAEIAAAADVILLPTGLAVDDLLPTVRLAHDLAVAGIDARRLLFVLCRAGDNTREIEEARQYVADAGYRCVAEPWPERTGYRRAHDEGRAASEARHPLLRGRAKIFAGALTTLIDDHIAKGRMT